MTVTNFLDLLNFVFGDIWRQRHRRFAIIDAHFQLSDLWIHTDTKGTERDQVNHYGSTVASFYEPKDQTEGVDGAEAVGQECRRRRTETSRDEGPSCATSPSDSDRARGRC